MDGPDRTHNTSLPRWALDERGRGTSADQIALGYRLVCRGLRMVCADRAVVLHEGTGVVATIRTDHEASLSADGQPPVALEDGDQVYVCAGDHVTEFIRFKDPGYFYRNLTSHMNRNPTAGDMT